MNIFSVSSDEPDVEVLLGNVAEAVHRWEEGEGPDLDLSIMLGETSRIAHRAHRLRRQWNVNSSAVIQSTRPGLGPWIVRFQSLVRRLTWWYLEPIVQQIRVFQRDTALVVDGLAGNQERLLARREELVTELTALQERVDALEARARATDGSASSDAEG
jgi:cell division protein FtsB